MKPVTRVRGLVGIAVVLLGHDRMRAVIAVGGVVIAVLAVTLLGGVGVGVVDTGQEQFEAADRDLWVTGGPLQIQPGTVGGIENTVTDAHEVAAEMQARSDVETAVPMSFQTVYISTDGEEFDTIVASGVPGGGSSVTIQQGDGFTGSDTHYADGNYDGEMTHEILVDPDTAEEYDLAVGDTLHAGGTLGSARRNQFEVVGISPTFSRFMGTGTVTMRLSELQTTTGTASTDRATLISISLSDDADPETVAADLEADYPRYEIRTNQQQLVATLRDQAVVLASGLSLVVLAVIAGAALTANLLMALMYQQRKPFSVLVALGAPAATPVTIAIVQALVVGTIGGVIGVLMTVPAVTVLNRVAETLTGFDGVVQTSPEILLGGFGIALVMSLLGSVASAWRIARSTTFADL